ncbi:MAG TPA: hypothetical protein VMH87_13785 [Pseudomonadales bacterium]|nr:hypothetical protein [Pseudomonadales bacterium]
MKTAKMVLLAGIATALISSSTFAVPIVINITGGTPSQDWGYSAYLDPGFQDDVPVANAPSSINLAGVNSITVNWNAPAGYMYVVNPPPAGLAGGGASLIFSAAYGSPGQASSLGSAIGSSFTVHTVYGSSPLIGQAIFDQPGIPAMSFTAAGVMTASSAPFAFTGITITADFSGIGASEILDRAAEGPPSSSLFGVYTGDFAVNGLGPNGTTYDILSDPGQLLTLEPISSGSVPDDSPTLVLAGFSFAGLLLIGRKKIVAGKLP